MPPSKLEKYVSILKALALRPLKIDSIAYKTKIDCTSVKRSLDFLMKNGLVTKDGPEAKHEVYIISERGLSVFRTIRILRHLEELKKTLPECEQTTEAATIMSEDTRGQK